MYVCFCSDLLFSGFISNSYDPLLQSLAYTGCTQITSVLNELRNRLDRVGADVFEKALLSTQPRRRWADLAWNRSLERLVLPRVRERAAAESKRIENPTEIRSPCWRNSHGIPREDLRIHPTGIIRFSASQWACNNHRRYSVWSETSPAETESEREERPVRFLPRVNSTEIQNSS